jgi:hypothetical protein
LPWSTRPNEPILQCGLFRSNIALPIEVLVVSAPRYVKVRAAGVGRAR